MISLSNELDVNSIYVVRKKVTNFVEMFLWVYGFEYSIAFFKRINDFESLKSTFFWLTGQTNYKMHKRWHFWQVRN